MSRKTYGKYDLRSAEHGDVFFYQVVFFLSIAYLVLLIANYDVNWVHPEIAFFSIPNVLKNGTAFLPADLLRAFDYSTFDGLPRARFISCALQIANVKFRVWLFHYLIPHPSLSLTWVFSLILSPWLLFRLLRDLTGSRISAWAGISWYCLSIGFLSGITRLFFPGKPMSLFFAILIACLASQIIRCQNKEEYYSKKVLQTSLLAPALGFGEPSSPPPPFARLLKSVIKIVARSRNCGLERDSCRRRSLLAYLGMLVALSLSFFLDESAWFIFFSIPILFPAIFSRPRNRLRCMVSYVFTFIAFLLMVSFLFPRITTKLGFGDFQFWRCVWSPTYSEKSTTWDEFKTVNIVKNGSNLISSQLVPEKTVKAPRREGQNRIYGCVQALVLLYGALVFLKLSGKEKKLMWQMISVLLLFFVFQTAIQAKHLPVIRTSYYYGSLFSFYFVLPLSLLFTVLEQPFATLNKLLLIILLIVSATNFISINRRSMANHEKMEKYGYPRFFPAETKEMTQGTRLSYAHIRKAWGQRGNKEALKTMRPNYPLRSLWLFRELEYIKE